MLAHTRQRPFCRAQHLAFRSVIPGHHERQRISLTRLVRPHVALVTTVALAHGAFFKDESEIADAKGEIFRGLEPGGIAVIPYHSPHRERLMAAAQPLPHCVAERRDRSIPRIIRSANGEDAVLRGAAALAVSGVLSPRFGPTFAANDPLMERDAAA